MIRYKPWDNLQFIKKAALERLVIDKLQASERFTNKNEKNTQIPVEEYRAKPIASSHYETEEELPNVIRKPTLIYLIATEE